MIVLDASVVIKWFQEEGDSEKARVFENKHINGEEVVVVPDLLLYEATNVLRYKKNLTEEEGLKALHILTGMELQAFTFSPWELKEAFSFARLCDVSVYDALYVILAKHLHCEFVTADEKLYQKLKKHDGVVLL